MPNHSVSRRIMTVMTVAAVALGGIALPAAARGGPPAGRGTSLAADTAAHSERVQERRDAAKARRAEAKARREAARARRAARFVAVGFITAVDTATVQVQLQGGTLKALRRAGDPVDFTVADDAKVKRDGELVAIEELQVGDHVMLKGAKTEDALVAHRVHASSPEEDEEEEEEEELEETSDVDDSGDDTDDVSGTDGGADAS